jgi:hypothetical protein
MLWRRSVVSRAAELSDHRNLTGDADAARSHDDPAGEPIAADEDDDPKDKAGAKGHRDDRGLPDLVVEVVVVVRHDR